MKKPGEIKKPTPKAKSPKQATKAKEVVAKATKPSVKAKEVVAKATKPSAKAKEVVAAKARKPAAKATGKAPGKPTGKQPKAKPVKGAGEQAFELVPASVAQKEMNLLCQQYPEAECELDYGSAFQLLTAVIMSAQTTDVTVNKVTPTLFERFPDAKALAEADLDEIKEIIKPTGFFNAKGQQHPKMRTGSGCKFWWRSA